MTAAAHALQYLVAGGFVLVAWLAYRDWRTWRGRGRAYLAAAVALLAVVSLLGIASSLASGFTKLLLTDLTVACFLGVGYCLFLFRDALIPVGSRVLAGLGVLCFCALVFTVVVVTVPVDGLAIQVADGLSVLIAWLACVGEPLVQLWRYSSGLPSVQQARLRALAAAYGGIIAITAIETVGYSATGTPAAQLGLQLFSLVVIVPVLYVSFAPPSWLRRLWRQPEEDAYASAIRDLLLFSPDRETLGGKALEWAIRLVGGDGGILVGGDGAVLARRGLDGGQAEVLRKGLKEARDRVARSPVDARNSAIFIPSESDQGSTGLAVLAGVFTPVFGSDELARLEQYMTATTAALERVTLVESLSRREEEVRALNLDLERRVRHRTSQLETSNRELEAFSYTVSHDLRAPLRAIDGFSRILLEEYQQHLPAEGRRYLGMIGSNAEAMGRLIDALLAFSRLSRAPMRRQVVDAGQVAQHAASVLKAGLDGRQVDIRVGDLPQLRSDPVLLEEVFTNLLSNAIKFTRDRADATIEVGVQDEAGGDPVLFVRDNGIGFDMRYADKIFGVFQRLHRSEDYDGTGAGLAIVQRIINRHGGRVWADAVPGQGATFYFTLGGPADDE